MKLIEIFDHLSNGELSQVFTGGDGRPINPRDYAKLGGHVSLGLNALHKRFFLRDGEVIVALHPTIDTYVLSLDYALSNTRSTQPVKYLLDTARPFTDGVLKIEAAYDVEEEKSVPLNKLDDPKSIRTIDFRTMIIPAVTETGHTRRITYRKDHRKLELRDFENPENTEIDLPTSYLEALLFYVASRVHNPLGGNSEGAHEGNYWSKRYEQACQGLTINGLQIDRDHNSTKFWSRGYV